MQRKLHEQAGSPCLAAWRQALRMCACVEGCQDCVHPARLSGSWPAAQAWCACGQQCRILQGRLSCAPCPADLLRPFFGMRDLAFPTLDRELRDLRPIPLDITEVSGLSCLTQLQPANRFQYFLTFEVSQHAA